MRMLRALLALLLTLGQTAQATELVMVEEPGCAWCAKWEAELGEIYPQTPEGQYAPLRKAQLHDIQRQGSQAVIGAELKRPVVFTPTFVLVDEGVEIARLEGYPGEDFFWGMLEKMLLQRTAYVAPEE